jgi:hypothetical protein
VPVAISHECGGRGSRALGPAAGGSQIGRPLNAVFVEWPKRSLVPCGKAGEFILRTSRLKALEENLPHVEDGGIIRGKGGETSKDRPVICQNDPARHKYGLSQNTMVSSIRHGPTTTSRDHIPVCVMEQGYLVRQRLDGAVFPPPSRSSRNMQQRVLHVANVFMPLASQVLPTPLCAPVYPSFFTRLFRPTPTTHGITTAQQP